MATEIFGCIAVRRLAREIPFRNIRCPAVHRGVFVCATTGGCRNGFTRDRIQAKDRNTGEGANHEVRNRAISHVGFIGARKSERELAFVTLCLFCVRSLGSDA